MIEVRQMVIEDFLLLMELNSGIYPEYDKLSDEHKRYLANINIIAGEAKSFFEDGRLVGIGGIRHIGLGEAWLITLPEIREKRSFSLLRKTKEVFASIRDKHNLWRVFATSKISETFLRHLGFKEQEKVLTWTRD